MSQPGLCCRTASTFARLADALGYVPKEDIFHALKAIVATQRDYGRRDDRKQARLVSVTKIGFYDGGACIVSEAAPAGLGYHADC